MDLLCVCVCVERKGRTTLEESLNAVCRSIHAVQRLNGYFIFFLSFIPLDFNVIFYSGNFGNGKMILGTTSSLII